MNKKFMETAVFLANKAADLGEVPVGAVLVKDGEIIAFAYNTSERDKNPLRHAEIKVIDEACKKLNVKVLTNCTLYVTLEPCIMCAAAIVHAKVGTVVFGAYDTSFGGFGGKTDVSNLGGYKPEVYGGICENKCAKLLHRFFKQIRD